LRYDNLIWSLAADRTLLSSAYHACRVQLH